MKILLLIRTPFLGLMLVVISLSVKYVQIY